MMKYRGMAYSDGIILRVAEANSTDPGMSRVRLDEESRLALGAEIGDVVEIEKDKKTVGRVYRARPEDENKGIVRIDSVMRNNCGSSIGDKVRVKKVRTEEAKRVTLAPIIRKDQRLKFGEGINEFVQKALIRRPMLEGDNISVPGLTLAGHSGLIFKVVKSQPTKSPVEVGEETKIEIRENQRSKMEGLLVKPQFLHCPLLFLDSLAYGLCKVLVEFYYFLIHRWLDVLQCIYEVLL